jgi:hypothetical protein
MPAAIVSRVLLGVLAVVAMGACGEGASPSRADRALLHVSGAQFAEGAMPAAADGPKVTSIETNNNILYPGVRGKSVNGRTEKGAASILVGLTGDVGYWIVPVGEPDVVVPGEYMFSTPLTFSPLLKPGEQIVVYQAVNADGKVGARFEQKFTLNETLAEGLLTVTLSWDSEADLDIHVVQPDNGEIWSKRISTFQPPNPDEPRPTKEEMTAGGVLDFDSNAQCRNDGRRKETITWTSIVPPGRYIVRVDAVSMCGAAVANWKLTAKSKEAKGNINASASGILTENDTRFAHGEGAGVLALEFDIP